MFTLFAFWIVIGIIAIVIQVKEQDFSFLFSFIMMFLATLCGILTGFSIENPEIGKETKYHELIVVNENYISSGGSFVTEDELRGTINSAQIKASAVKSAPYIKEDIIYYKRNKWSLQTAIPSETYSLVFEIPKE